MISDGEPASDGDVWFRILNNKEYIVRGNLHYNAIKGQIRKTLAEDGRPWQYEMSGRIRSIAGTVEQIKEHAVEYCKKQNRSFHGVALSKCKGLSIDFEGIKSVVHFTPIKEEKYADPAHADLAFFGKTIEPYSEEEERLLLLLQKKLSALYPEQMESFFPDAAQEPLAD
jgi:hypothetical protein